MPSVCPHTEEQQVQTDLYDFVSYLLQLKVTSGLIAEIWEIVKEKSDGRETETVRQV